jgi:uncharacterized protein
MSRLELSLAEARGLMLAAQGLLEAPPERPGPAELRATVERLGVVQIDTISVVTRSQYLVLWSRLGAYDPAHFDALLYPERAVFEYWSHAASIVPMRDWPYYRAGMVHAPEWHMYSDTRAWMEQHPDVVRQTLEAIRERGPLASADFERPADGRRVERWDWYGPKESRVALDVLWTLGELMVHSRRGGQKVYDLREHVLAELDGRFALPADDALPGHAERLRYFAERTIEALGVVTADWLWDYFRLRRHLRAGAKNGRDEADVHLSDMEGLGDEDEDAAEPAKIGNSRARAVAMLAELAAAGLVVPARIEGLEGPAYVDAGRLLDLERLRGGLRPERTTLLSPFDSLIWDRKRAQQLFGFEVVFEAYVLPQKRRYGYYCLAILHRGELVGRLDAKAARAEGVLLARAVYLEPGVAVDEALLEGLAGALRDLARFLGLAEVRVERTQPAGLARRLAARLKRNPRPRRVTAL